MSIGIISYASIVFTLSSYYEFESFSDMSFSAGTGVIFILLAIAGTTFNEWELRKTLRKEIIALDNKIRKIKVNAISVVADTKSIMIDFGHILPDLIIKDPSIVKSNFVKSAVAYLVDLSGMTEEDIK